MMGAFTSVSGSGIVYYILGSSTSLLIFVYGLIFVDRGGLLIVRCGDIFFALLARL